MGKIVRKTQMCTSGPLYVYVDEEKDKIVRITPIDFTDEDPDSWVVEARGRKLSPPRRTTTNSYNQSFKSMVYSDKRLLYPMKRVDFDHTKPPGQRNEGNRGTSEFVRISWDEALDIVCSEITRCKREVGPGAMMFQSGSHHLWGNLGYRFSALYRFMGMMGIQFAAHNPDSWEGWHWGATHIFGHQQRLGNPSQVDLCEDALKNTEMMVFWSSDPETTGGIYGAHESYVRRKWLKEMGVKFVFIDPYHNHTAALHKDKWLAPRVGTDAALALGIAHTWLVEGTYDKEYVKTHTFGFEEWSKYVLGETDGIPKTAEWAAEETEIPAHDIRALAREWAKNKTTLAAGGWGGWGGACRSAIGMEYARMMVALIGMQGMGKPGIYIWCTTQGAPVDADFYFPGYSDGGICGDIRMSAAGGYYNYRMFDGVNSRPITTNISVPEGSCVPRMRMPECVMDGYTEWSGYGFVGDAVEHQFHRLKYPADGYAPVQMLWNYGGSRIGTMGESNRYPRMYRHKNLAFVVGQAIWDEGEVQFSDVILPACTNFERWDIGEWANNSGYNPDSQTTANHRVMCLQKKCVEPLGESKSDYDIFSMIAERFGMKQTYTEGKDILQWAEQHFNASDIPKYMSWEKFCEKGYFVVPVTDKKPSRPAYRWFAEDRQEDTPGVLARFRPADQVGLKGLPTQSGKIEYVSNSLKRFGHYDTDDKERPLMPMYLESWEGHHTERFKKYPLAVVAPHPRFSFHTMGDAKDSFQIDIKDHRVLVDGHYYWILRMNKKDAQKRGLREGDLVKAFNERGEVIFYLQVTERVMPGTLHCYESCADYIPLGEPGNSPDIAGCINILTPGRFMSKYASGMATEHALLEVEKWEGK